MPTSTAEWFFIIILSGGAGFALGRLINNRVRLALLSIVAALTNSIILYYGIAVISKGHIYEYNNWFKLIAPMIFLICFPLTLIFSFAVYSLKKRKASINYKQTKNVS